MQYGIIEYDHMLSFFLQKYDEVFGHIYVEIHTTRFTKAPQDNASQTSHFYLNIKLQYIALAWLSTYSMWKMVSLAFSKENTSTQQHL